MALAAIEGKVALITGAAGGLGRAFAEALLERGAKVCVSDVNNSRGVVTEQELQNRFNKDRVFFHKCDVTQEKEFEGAFKETLKRFGKLDILCNNAGIGNEKNWQLMMDINLTAVIQGTMLGLKYMATPEANGGDIINIGSAAGVLPMPFGPVYTATKHAVVGYSRSIGALSHKIYGVRVNCLCPSFTDTDIMKTISDDSYTELKGVDVRGLADKMVEFVGLMKPVEVADCFMKILDAKSSAGVWLWTPSGKSALALPKTVEQMFAKNSKI